jgi:hypothetical protein
MLTIRDVQMLSLERDAQRRSLVEHVRKYLPDVCEGLRPSDLSAAIDRHVARASGYGFTAYKDVEQFTVLTMSLGEGFENRDEFAWARAILKDRHPARAPFRATWLFDRIVKQLG